MVYKYTYKDWEKGNISWNHIESNKYEEYYVSDDCIAKIQKHQQKILDELSSRYTENLVKGYISNRRKSKDRSTFVSGLLKTIDNLLSKNVDSFKDSITVEEVQAMTESFPKERNVKVIPPLNWVSFDRNEILGIQKAYSDFYSLGKWNIEVIETPIEVVLLKYVECYCTLLAKAYYDFICRLRQYEGDIYNTFKSEFSDFDIGQMRVDLIRRGFIAKNTDRKIFIKIFQGSYLFKSERINWLKNLETLRYFITQLDNKLDYQKEYPKWDVVCNCFIRSDKDINSESLRKATKITNYPSEKTRLDNTLSLLI